VGVDMMSQLVIFKRIFIGLLNCFWRTLPLLVFLTACTVVTARRAPTSSPEKKKWTLSSQHFEGLDACFILYNLKTRKIEKVVGETRCRERVAPCSTFKVPLAVMAFDSEVLKDENTLYKWDGVDRGIAAWNRDHTAAGWMRESVVWYSQELTPKIGAEKISSYLKKFQYGTQDFSGGLKDAWLTHAPFINEKPHNTLKISAYEQLDFMKKLWTNSLPASPRAMDLTKKITFLETSENGVILNGKTGSGFVENSGRRLGWFVSHLQKGNEEYISVLSFTDKEEFHKSLFAGLQAKEITKEILAENQMW
jgi:beta-lactamase class D